MIDYEREFRMTPEMKREALAVRTFKYVYGWMTLGLVLSGAVAWYVAHDLRVAEAVLQGPGFWGCVVVEFALVFALSSAINRISPAVAVLMFLGYAALNGLTLSLVFLVYDLGLVQNIFFITAGMFAGLAVYGTVTRSDLSGVGSVCGMALWGVIVASLVNLFMGSARLDWFVSFAGILVFTGLTMYDAQKIKELARQESSADAGTVQKVAILGALSLYLDFINLFLYLLRFFGRER